MKAWNFVNFLNENACLNAWILFVVLILFFFSFEERIYECIKFCEFSEWKWMLECMSSFVFLILFFFLKNNAFTNAWNFVNFLNENACLNTLILFVFLILFYMNAWNLIFFYFFIFEECIYECMKFDFILFCYFWRMHIRMHEILFYYIFEEWIY